METVKEKYPLSGPKSEHNESGLPLLESSEETDFNRSETKGCVEEDSKGNESCCNEEANKDGDSGTKQSLNDDASKKKERKKKEKGPASGAPSFTERLIAGMNLTDRDTRNVNDHVNITFHDVLAEPDANHGFDATWSLAFHIFSGTKLWIYRITSALLAIPCGLMWGVIFSLLTLLNVWLISPVLCLFKILMDILHKLWSSVISTFLDPIFQSAGRLFSSVHIKTDHVQAEAGTKS